MITLPIATNATRVSSANATTASAAADVGMETTTAAGETPAKGEGGNQGFLTLLGNKLLSLAQQSETGQASTAAATAATDDADAAQSPKAKLSALMAALDKPETLSALLQPGKSDKALKTEETTSEDNQTAAPTLNTSDMQTLQALFAMLPPAAAQQPAALTKNAESLTDEPAIKGTKQSTLSSLLSAAETTESDSDKTSGKAESLTATVGKESPKATADTPTLTAAFQQALNNSGKSADKENSSSVPAATITNNVISAASSLVTPTTTSLVTAPASAQLSSQLGSQEWQQALGQQILMFSKNGQQTAELHLHPQDLGSIQISLKLDNDQAQLSMVSNHSQVRAALEAALPQLRTALAENGISLGQSNVSSDAFQQGQSFSGQQEQQRNNHSGNTFSLASENDSDVTPIAVPAALQARAAGSSAVDIFA
ncbi:flagellar hook-length control protein FliK [Erwinia sp. MMLR14_017]|uniref:flagellar hook-length control protein FliK n=1 Tax=Erwinia sp. MMLR14_017 TaxID=3093842 RepID=UPI0029904B94|nr:flagellar hook-length control protein FliK [Erwinia sp. MMLR14_017]MDW8846713.1 flagellar hook-length control protein FliK [Erwinia sp. MMLR14_017]